MNTILQKRIEEAAKKTACPQCVFNDGGTCNNDDDCKLFDDFVGLMAFALQNQWISVEEDLPPYDKTVIGMDYMPELAWDDQTITFVHRSNNPNVVTDKNKFCVYPPTFCKVTHWMEIPSLKGGKE